ncbi:hypothetical protein N7532_008468 [Penicillium argentinense]|uniref:CST complex subunit Stn1 N-terminal domain-containing protein n=1 Tax=Penicillium argentinense TaxID=1131581 RepID=A0A9W9EXM6_9EURO|nr:uncharacterized protein N7532_008468 [Penicillium argentinense]KAJ5089784.1 hypothetical protein N7532_008468 [Penicillium argentinense]
METATDADLVFYPAFCFKASPTHFTWVKMAIADVHRLKRPKGFEGQKVFFYKNHPISYIAVAGVIVARTDVPRRTILTIDDSSGATLDIVVLQADPKEKDSRQSAQTLNFAISGIASGSNPENISEEKPDILAMNQTVHVSATDRSIIDISQLQPGAIVKVKGTLSIFRSDFQLNLERFSMVPDTNAEMKFIDEKLQFLVGVLSDPWVLLDEEVEQLRREAERGHVEIAEERRRAERRLKRRAEQEEKDQRHIQRRYEKEEKKRASAAGVCKENGARVMADIKRRRGASGSGSSS